MTAQPHIKQINRTAIRPAQWLSVLEQELKSRVGWVDEAVSPFAGRRSAPALRKASVEPIRPGKAA